MIQIVGHVIHDIRIEGKNPDLVKTLRAYTQYLVIKLIGKTCKCYANKL